MKSELCGFTCGGKNKAKEREEWGVFSFDCYFLNVSGC